MTTTQSPSTITVIGLDQALNGEWQRCRPQADVVRVLDPPHDRWADLANVGFYPKPQVVTWRARTAASEEEFLARFSWKDRQNVRAAYRRATADGLTVGVRSVDSRLLDAFLPLYEAEVAQMRHGWPVAAEYKERILAEADRYFAVCAWNGADLVGASLNLESRARDEVRARFAAFAPHQRRAGLSRMIYMRVIEAARERGFAWVSLGSDPNLYGHMAKPGLFGFKNRLGFAALPSHVVDPGSGADQADRVIGLSALTDPSLVLAYATGPDGCPRRGPRLQVELYSSRADLDLRPYIADYTAGSRLHHPDGA